MGEEADADWQAGLIEAGREMVENEMKNRQYATGYRDPKCPKCGITLGNKMSYACSQFHCPVGLN